MVPLFNAVAFEVSIYIHRAHQLKYQSMIHGYRQSVFAVWNLCDRHLLNVPIVFYRGVNKPIKLHHFWMDHKFMEAVQVPPKIRAFLTMVYYCLVVDHRDKMPACTERWQISVRVFRITTLVLFFLDIFFYNICVLLFRYSGW